MSVVKPDPQHFQCCDQAVQTFRRCNSCEAVWVHCEGCSALFSDLLTALYEPPVSSDGELGRALACPECGHSVPTRFAEVQLLEQHQDLPLRLRDLALVPDDQPTRRPTDLMYVDLKNGTHPRIMRVATSKSGRTVYVEDHVYERVGSGYKYNFVSAKRRYAAWISRPRRDGLDALYPETVVVADDAREEYWNKIRKRPDLVERTRFRSPGKYTKRGRGKRNSGPSLR